MLPTPSESDKPLQLEDLIEQVDYEWLNNIYVPSVEAISFINFIKLVNGEQGESNESPVFHYHMIDSVLNHKNNLAVVFRGGAKTSVLHEYLILYIAVYGTFFSFGEVDVMMYVSDTTENGVRNLRNQLEYRYLQSEFLQKYIKYTRFTEDEWEFTNVSGKQLFVRGFGALTGVRGFKRYGKRPQLANLDDLLSDKNASSPTIMARLEDIIYKAVRAALDPERRKIIWTGTPFSKADPLYKAAGSKGWNTVAYPIAKKMPCTREEFSGAWDDRFSYNFLMEEWKMLQSSGKLEAFNQELMLRITSEEDRLILDTDIIWYERNTLLHNRSSYNFYITTDFATSEKQSADFSLGLVWAINSKGYIFLVDGFCARQGMDKNINELFSLAQKYKPQSVGLEVSGQQGGFIPWVQQQMLERNVWFTLASENNKNALGIRPVTDKLKRFQVVVPWFKAKTIFFPSELKDKASFLIELMDELQFATKNGLKAAHDDAIDATSMLASMNLWRPSEEAVMEYQEETQTWQDILYNSPQNTQEETRLDSYIV